MNVAKGEEFEVNDFFNYIWGSEEGFAYIALKSPQKNQLSTGSWHQKFFNWPDQAGEIVSYVLDKRAEYEVYFGPALYREETATKEFVKGATVFWTEFDGKLPETLAQIPDPTLRIQSSDEFHQHWYWRTNRVVGVETLENHNRALTYFLGADVSSWDATQILRVPHTLNHKRSRKVVLLSKTEQIIAPEVFEGLPTPPPLIEAPIPESIPPVEDVIAKYKFHHKVWNLFRNGVPDGKRSDGLMSLGYYLAELQLSAEEMMALLLNSDARWGKFEGRSDQLLRLAEIITRSRIKFPYLPSEKDKFSDLQSIGLLSLLNTEVKFEWIWEGFLQEKGYIILSGPQGVGKTQFSLNAGFNMALGYDYLEQGISKPRKIGFFSLEMGFTDIKQFLMTQSQGYTQEELELLEQNFRIFPMGEPLYLNQKDTQEWVESVIEKEELQGIIVDSLGSTTNGELSQEGSVRELIDWNDRVRQKHDIFTWFIHHHRKAQGDNKKPNKLSDVYGNQYITNRATTVLCLWETNQPSTVELIPLKVRMAAKPPPFLVFKDTRLQFTKKKVGLNVVTPEENTPVAKDENDEEESATDVASYEDEEIPSTFKNSASFEF